MSFFDDISMGLGLKEKDDAYRERTAETIKSNQGSEAADRYRESQGMGAVDGPPLRTGSGNVVPRATTRPPVRPGTAIPRYPGSTSPYYDAMRDRSYGTQGFFNMFTGNEMGIDPELDPNSPEGKAAQAELDTYLYRTREAKRRADDNFMGTGMSQAEYAKGQQYGFTNFSDGRVGVSSGDRGPAPTVGLPAAADSTDFNPNNAFLRGRMAQMREQQGMLPPPQIPGLPPQPRPQMPQQLAGIMQLQDRSNISPAMRYAAENYNRLGGRQMTNDEYERGRAMIQGQSV